MRYATFLMLLLAFNVISLQAEPVNFFADEADNPSQRYVIEALQLKTRREIFVHTPADYEQMPHQRYPVLYLLDGKRNLKHTIATVNMLVSKRKMPKIIIVAIPSGETRQEDYTPTGLSIKKNKSKAGNSDRFTRFLKFDLLPYIDNQFRTEPYRIVVGNSRGGLFVVNDLINKTGLFQARFAFSPALWVDDYAVIGKIAKSLQSEPASSGFLYATAGGKENANIISSLYQLRAELEKQTVGSLKWDTQVTVDDSHATAPFVGTYLALKRLYTNWDVPSKHYKSGINAYLHQYQLLSDDFGYRVIPEEYRLRYMGTDYFMANEIEKASEVFKINSQLYPYSAMAHDNYGEALEAQGLLKQAMTVMEQAMSLLKSKQDPNYKAITEHYDKVKKRFSQGL